MRRLLCKGPLSKGWIEQGGASGRSGLETQNWEARPAANLMMRVTSRNNRPDLKILHLQE